MGSAVNRTRSGRSQSSKGAGILVLFGLPFVGVGIGMAYLSYATIRDARDAMRWIPTTAAIRSLDLECHSGSDSTTYQVVCTYSYVFDGAEYESSQVGFSSGADNIGSWHQDVHARLEASRQRDGGVECFVNPEKPHEAVLDRDLRIGLVAFYFVFVVCFGCAGTACVAGGLHTVFRRRSIKATPGERATGLAGDNPEWASGVISASTGLLAVILWGVAIVWSAVSSLVPFILFSEMVGKVDPWMWALLAFPAIGLLLLCIAIRQTLAHRRFGRSFIELKSIPGIIGEHFKANLVIVGDLPQGASVDVTLRCEETTVTGSGKHRKTRRETTWSDSRQVEVHSAFDRNRFSVPVDFAIPADCSETDTSDARHTVKWKLTGKAGIPGVNLGLSFEVPILERECPTPDAVGIQPLPGTGNGLG